MKKLRLIPELLCLLIVLAGVIYCIESKYKEFKTPADYLFENVAAHKNDSSVLIIGNSHTGDFALYFPDTTQTVVNLSIGGQDLFREYVVLRKVCEESKTVKKLIMGLDYDIIGYNQVLSGQDYIDKQYYVHVDTLYDNSFSNRVTSSLAFFRSNRDISFLFASKPKGNNKPKINFVPLTNGLAYSEEACKKRAIEHTSIKFKARLISENLNLLEKIIQLCQKNKMELVIVNTPKSQCYKSYSNETNIQMGKKKIYETLKKYNVRYHDYYNDEEFMQEDFVDYDHLNKKGINKLFKKLEGVI